ncbi:hypothetical protein O3G_MSEX006612 [Manduca sexta]|uniref:Fibronectin type-III domain-containing protein n=1 Tax=Manduca sexta TaxID=7130 RepID=A0A922CLD7_MANSE|nr:hypothetical protein O3G_MSEX006612 [Manduca sexta]
MELFRVLSVKPSPVWHGGARSEGVAGGTPLTGVASSKRGGTGGAAGGPGRAGTLCPSMDIRNNPEQINRLRGCRVIEGQLSIVLMERSTPKIYENISFPELREVTGYIMIYRTKVRNLGDLFPNLTVVRGIQLFKDFAIVIFDNEHLEALGLRSLMRIERGGVRIQHNDRLCYTNTIDWTRIIAGDADNIIRSNYDTRLCGLCPNAQSRIEDHRQSQQQCPTDSKGKLLCWDDKHCQKICPSSCGVEGCMPNGTCCHSSCLGGCDGPGATHCHVCKNYSLESSEPGSKRICVDTCPAGTYTLFRRCVTEQQCRSMPPPPQPVGTGDSSYFRYALNIRSYKILNNKSCVYMCPSGFTEEGDIHNSTCKLCPSWGCRRECVGGKIDSVATAEQARTSRHIEWNTLSVLESALGEIKEIEGSLQVTRSYPLVSLMFLKKLEKIIGVSTAEHKGQVLHIINNKNLELLWDWSKGRTINITGGTLYIHSNPKLCYNQLLPLKNMTSNPRSNFTELEVSQESNGYQASCLPDVLKLRVWELRRTAVVLTWNMYCPEDMRKLLGYSIYYIAAEKNVTLYDQRDACTDTWNVLDMTIDEARNGTRDELPPPETNKTSMILNPCSNMQPSFYPVTPLVPFTRYAAYVKTYTTMQDRRGAQSSIIYFKTLPGAPSPPTSVTVELRTPYSVSIKWAPPTMPNANALANMIKASLEEAPETQEEKTTGDVKNGSCACNEESKSSTRFTSRAEEERMESINFENDVYKKADRPKSKTMANRIKRSLDISLSSMLVKLTENRDPRPGFNYSNSTDEDGYVKSLYYELDGKTESLTVDSMRHFTWYTVNIWACRARADNETKEQYDDTWCSERAYYTFRTSELPNADVVNNFKAEIVKSNKTFPDVNLKWDPPANPNGFVVAYNVHYSRVEDSNQGQDVGLGTCIISDDFETAKHTHTLRALSPGNYSVRVTPITVSGAGNVSNDVYVFIPERAVESGYEWAWGLAGGGVVMLALLGGGVWYARRGLMSPNEISKLFPSVNPEYESTVYVPDEWEVPRANIEFIRELGQGSFGMVYEGRAKNIEKGKPETRCAVKTVNEHATDSCFCDTDEEQEMQEVNVGAVATGSGSNLFGVSGRLASWVRELSSLRSRTSMDAAAEALQPLQPLAPAPAVVKGPNGVLRPSHASRAP